MMLRRFSTLLLLAGLCLPLRAQVVYEDFESGTSLAWTAFDGVYNGVFANPDTNFVNNSDSVGSYTKSDLHAYSLFLAEVTTPLDLSVNNQFKIQVYAPVASQFIMKLEGSGGAIERTKNIANANVWQEYTFDFSSAAGNTTLTKIILFFDAGTQNTADTYLFDNLVAEPAGPCAGTVANPDIIDDFECQRNATYGAGWDILTAIANPDASGINTSAGVGRYEDPISEWSALVIDYQNPIDLSTKNTVVAKVWAPTTGQILFKLEGGVSAPAERFVPVTQTNTWVEYKADFSDQAAANHKKLAIFFNAGVLPTTTDIYYIDDIGVEETPQGNIIEDFEPQKLTWGPFNSDPAVHGTFSQIANPDATGANTTPQVGSYVKGSSAFSTLTAALGSALDLSQFTQLNLQVWAPTGSQKVTLQLSSPTQGVKEVEQTLTATGSWIDLTFDFANFNAITDFDQVSILFDPGVATTQTFYFDNLTQGVSTVDPCEGIDPIPNFLDDFECQRNATYGAGSNRLTAINNPDVSQGNPSTKVGEYNDPNDEWSALVIDFGGVIDLSIYNQLLLKIWSPGLVPLKFKLEGGTSASVEVDQTVSAVNSWQSYQVDFSPYVGQNHQKIAIFFNAGVLPGSEIKYYIDDIRMGRSAYTGCIATFESAEFTLKGWRYFANGSLDNTVFEVITNPDQSAANPSDSVGVFLEASDGSTFAGMFTDPEAPISLPNDNKTIRMKMWADQAASMVMKLENSSNGAPNSGDIFAEYTTPNQWVELTWDFSAIVPDNALYNRITLIPNITAVPDANKTYYFDDIVIADGVCSTTGIRERFELPPLAAYPNPTTGSLRIESGEALTRVELRSLMGQQVLARDLRHQTATELDLSGLAPGIYLLAGYNGDRLVARTKVVKE
ncbi:MAG: hypothetical protein OHK0039_43770 [Bacteroidia bacterium]